MSNNAKTMGFQTEVKQILDLVIHSLYSNPEIFLRELISNASDALDKLRFLALSNAALYGKDPDLKIIIELDEKLKTITITDNGIGMTLDDAIENLGTIAKSGTKEFLQKLANNEKQSSHMIGQFGVGFYSAFIVAKKVVVRSLKAGLPVNEAMQWESAGDGEFSVSNITKDNRGTEIVLHIKDDALDFLHEWRLKNIIHKYSDHICWPIMMQKTAEDIENTDDKDNNKDDIKASKEKNQEMQFETVNKATALWTLQKSEISDEEYNNFYQQISHDFQNPLIWSHNHVEGKQHYISLLYIPSHAPFDLWQQDVKHGLKLYVKRVFIMDEATQFLPKYLRFIKGIIDAGDLPLNVSRELLQDNKQVESIKAACTKRVLSMLEKMSQDKEKYATFWKEFGLVLKEGIIEDFTNKDAIAKLLRFASTSCDTQELSLQEYVAKMPESQDKIYYITAPTYNAAKNSPHLEVFRKKGIEVLLLSDKVDEWLVNYLQEFEGKKLQSISKGKVDLGDSEETNKEQEKTYASMLEQIKKVLGEKIKDVRLSTRLIDSPTCVIADEGDISFEMARILQSAGQKVPEMKPVLELNPEHDLIKKLHEVQDDVQFELMTLVLFEEAILAEGGQLDNPVEFVKRMNKLLSSI